MYIKKPAIGLVTLLAGLSVYTTGLQAQQLEEIVVTAQRREQSLQEVPISIDAYTGEDVRKQGFRDLEALASMTPGIIASPQQDQTIIMIRGFGTTGNALTVEQAAPIFMDGIHFGRMAQAKLAYMDLERIEILKGPQPVFFGNNATAGAFSVISKKPTASWEGDVDAELGNNNTKQVSGGVGGPISDTLGVRFAGKYESTDGYMVDLIDGSKFPHQDDWGGRVTLQWNPNEKWQVTTKFELSDIDAGSEGKIICLTGDPMVYGSSGPLVTGAQGAGGTEGEPFAIWSDPPIGEGTVIPHAPLPTTDGDCFKSKVTRSNEGPYYDVPTNVRQTNVRSGMLDIREAAQAWMDWGQDPIASPQGAFTSGIGGYETIDAINSYVDVAYDFDNEINMHLLTGFSKYDRETSEENFDSAFYENNQIRNENFDQWSSELRFTSPTGGRIEWMAGLFIQDTTLDNVTGNLRANVRDSMRMNTVWEDVRWKSAFSTITLNFLDNKASIDLGGRYSDISKLTFAGGQVRQWIVNGCPSATVNLTTPVASCVTQTGLSGTLVQITDPSVHDIFLPYDPALGLWHFLPRGVNGAGQAQITPENWKGTQGADVVGLTRYYTPSEGIVGQGPIGGRNYPGAIEGKDGDFGSTEFDPQVVLRYRPTENHSVFARWAQSFKLGGFDTGQTTIPATYAEFDFDNERSETFEIGSKGSLFDGRGRYDLTFFETTFSGLQLQAATGRLDDPNANVNAGAQVVKGVEASFDFAVTDNLTMNIAGAIMDGKMDEFFGAPCNAAERRLPELGCDFDGIEAATGIPVGTIDRSGQQAPYTPDWSMIYEADYRYPVMDRYEISANLKGMFSDGYFTSSQDFSKDVVYDSHADLSLSLGFGAADGTWRVAGWARNLLEPHQTYNRELDFTRLGSIVAEVSASNFTTYGLKFEYSYK